MKRIFRMLLGSAIHILVLMAVGNATLIAQSDLKLSRSVIGVWKTTVTPRDCATGDQIMPAFEGLLTFSFGGTLAETSSGSAPATRGPGHGLWRREISNGWRAYSMSFVFQRFSPGGLIGTTVVRQELHLDSGGDAFNSTGTVDIVSNGGQVLATLCTTSTGERFE